MIGKILGFVGKIAYGGKILEIIAKVNAKLSGYRSEIIIGLLAVVYLLEVFGVLPKGAFETASAPLLGALSITSVEKIKKVVSVLDKVVKPKE